MRPHCQRSAARAPQGMTNPLPMKEYLHFFLKAAHCGSYRRWRLQLLVTIRPQTGPRAGVQPCREMRSCAGEDDTTLCQIRAGRRQVSPLERQHRPQPSRVCGRAAGLKGLSGPMGGHFHMRTRNDMMTGAGETHEAMLRTGCAWYAHEPAASRGRPQPQSQRGLLDSAVAGGGKANFVV